MRFCKNFSYTNLIRQASPATFPKGEGKIKSLRKATFFPSPLGEGDHGVVEGVAQRQYSSAVNSLSLAVLDSSLEEGALVSLPL